VLLLFVVSFVVVVSAAVIVAASAAASSFTAHFDVDFVDCYCCNRFDTVPNVRRHTCDVSL